MDKQVLILKGSPRQWGNSAVLADRLAQGARESGAQVEDIYLHGLEIRPCDGCDLCRESGTGCVIADEMNLAGMVYGSLMDVGDAQKQLVLMDQAFQLGLRPGKTA